MFKKLSLLVFFVLASFLFSLNSVYADELNAENAFLGIVKIKLFSVDEKGYLGHVSSGSGVIINSDGLVLTNHHVISEESSFNSDIEEDVAYQICLTLDKNEEPNCSYSASLVASDKDKDLALLKINNINGLSSKNNFSYLNISYDNVNTGENLKILGYPGTGGNTITVTEGVITGKESKYNMDWLKTDADISFGNSGGAAIDESGNLIGIPTQSHSSTLGSTGYLLEISSVEDWIEANKKKTPISGNLDERLIDLTKKQREIASQNTFSISEPAFELVKDSNWTFDYSSESSLSIDNEEESEGGSVSIFWDKYLYNVGLEDVLFINNNEDANIFLLGAKIVKVEDVEIGGINMKKIRISLFGSIQSFYLFTHNNYYFGIAYDYGNNDQDKEVVDDIINSIDLNDFNPNINDNDYKIFRNDYQGISWDLNGTNWLIRGFNNLSSPARLELKDNPEVVANIMVKEKENNLEGLSNNEIYEIDISQLESSLDYLSQAGGYSMKILNASSYATINEKINDATMVEIQVFDDKEGNNILIALSYDIYASDKVYTIELKYSGQDMDKYREIKESFVDDVMKNLKIDNYKSETITEDPIIYNKGKSTDEESVSEEDIDNEGSAPEEEVGDEVDEDNSFKEEKIKENMADDSNKDTYAVKELSITNDKMYSNLKGKIILKIEDNGEAYYINPSSQKMSFLGRPQNAFDLMRSEGIGISNENLSKIPVGLIDESLGKDSDNDGLSDLLEDSLGTDKNNNDTDGDGYGDREELLNSYSPTEKNKKMSIDENFAESHRGKIFIQVEGEGEAWYVNPKDNKRYYLGRPNDAFAVMRNLGLGISNNDFDNL